MWVKHLRFLRLLPSPPVYARALTVLSGKSRRSRRSGERCGVLLPVSVVRLSVDSRFTAALGKSTPHPLREQMLRCASLRLQPRVNIA